MSDKSKIEWTDTTWNPVTGCTKVSPGCTNCYIERTRPMRMANRRFTYRGKALGVTTGVQLHPERLEAPRDWRKPRRVFVNSMSDLFHEDVPDEFISHVFAVMSMTPQHSYQILTKRPERMADYLTIMTRDPDAYCFAWARDGGFLGGLPGLPLPATAWPLPNVWLGVSVENQHWADIRIPLLLQTPAAVRFVSYEPALGPVRFGSLKALNQIIVGGESGPRARPFDPEWARQTIAQCRAAGVAPFVKQLGSVWAKKHGDTGKGGDMSLWPEDLRVREFPR